MSYKACSESSPSAWSRVKVERWGHPTLVGHATMAEATDVRVAHPTVPAGTTMLTLCYYVLPPFDPQRPRRTALTPPGTQHEDGHWR